MVYIKPMMDLKRGRNRYFNKCTNTAVKKPMMTTQIVKKTSFLCSLFYLTTSIRFNVPLKPDT